MSESPQKLGYFVSGAMHLALLGLIVFGFSSSPKFDDASESLPVESVTRAEMNEIMQGEKDAKPQPTPPLPPAKPVQQAAAEPTPPPPPTPPEPPPELKRADDPPPPPPPKPPEPKPAPTPPPKPEIKQAEDAPEPPVKPKLPPPPPEKPKEPPPEKFKPDLLAKLLKETPTPKPAPTSTAKPYDPNAIAKLLGPTKVADATPTGAAPQGLPNHHASRMSATLKTAMDDWFSKTYLSCWNLPPTLPQGEAYVPEVKLEYKADGTLASNPVLLNPPTDPAWRPLAESAVRAALKCNPLRVPAEYSPYFDDWRAKTIHFDPQEAMG